MNHIVIIVSILAAALLASTLTDRGMANVPNVTIPVTPGGVDAL